MQFIQIIFIFISVYYYFNLNWSFFLNYFWTFYGKLFKLVFSIDFNLFWAKNDRLFCNSLWLKHFIRSCQWFSHLQLMCILAQMYFTCPPIPLRHYNSHFNHNWIKLFRFYTKFKLNYILLSSKLLSKLLFLKSFVGFEIEIFGKIVS